MSDYELRNKVEAIVNRNITHYPYEGDTIDKGSIVSSIVELIKEERGDAVNKHIDDKEEEDYYHENCR